MPKTDPMHTAGHSDQFASYRPVKTVSRKNRPYTQKSAEYCVSVGSGEKNANRPGIFASGDLQRL